VVKGRLQRVVAESRFGAAASSSSEVPLLVDGRRSVGRARSEPDPVGDLFDDETSRIEEVCSLASPDVTADVVFVDGMESERVLGLDAEADASGVLKADLRGDGAVIADLFKRDGKRLQVVVSLRGVAAAEDEPVLVGVLMAQGRLQSRAVLHQPVAVHRHEIARDDVVAVRKACEQPAG